MEPPPAPISISSTVAIWIGSPLPRRKRFSRAASKPQPTSGSPPSTSASFAVVPPMSKASTRSRPALRPNQAPASAPAAGPLSSNCTGARLASATWVNPPFESIRNNPPGMPASRSAVSSRSR